MRIVVRLLAEPVHYKKRRSLHRRVEHFRVTFVGFYEAHDVSGKGELFHLEGDGRAFGVLNQAKVVALLCLSEHGHV